MRSSLAVVARKPARGRVRAQQVRDMVVIDGFLDEQECAFALEELEIAVWTPSLVYVQHADGVYRDIHSELRTSDTAQQRWFSNELKELISRIEDRLSTLFDVDRADLETWQATTYPDKGTFYYHLDAGYWDDHYAGDRILTFVLYLTTPIEGGGTHFRALDTYVPAKAGRLLVWNNLFPNGDADYSRIHSSAPLLAGRKTTLVTWQRQKRYRTWLNPKLPNPPQRPSTPRPSRRSRSATDR